MNDNFKKVIDILKKRRRDALKMLQSETLYDMKLAIELMKEIEIEFDKLEDENLCLKVELEEKDFVIEQYQEIEEENCAMKMRRSY